MNTKDIDSATREQLADELGDAGEYTEDWETADIDDLRGRVRRLHDSLDYIIRLKNSASAARIEKSRKAKR